MSKDTSAIMRIVLVIVACWLIAYAVLSGAGEAACEVQDVMSYNECIVALTK